MLSQRTVSKLEQLLVMMCEELSVVQLYPVRPLLESGDIFKYLYEAGVPSLLLNYLKREYDYQPRVFVRAIHEGHPIQEFARLYLRNSYLADQDAVEYADIILMIAGVLALEKYGGLDSGPRTLFQRAVNEFLISSREDGFPFVSGAFRDSKGDAVNVGRLWDLSSPRPSSATPIHTPTAVPTPARVQVPAAVRKPSQVVVSEEFRGGGPSGKSAHSNYEKKSQDSEKRWWEKPLGIIILGILVTVIGGLIVWAVTRHYDKPTPPTAAAQPTTPPQPQAALPESKPQENTQPQSPHLRSRTEKKVKIDQHGAANGAVGGSITTGPCSNVQVGGHGNQAAVNCDTSRRLSQQQIASIKFSAQNVCATLPLISVTASNGDQEAQRYAYDFVEALRSGGCKSDLALPIPGLTPDVSGIHIAVRDYNNIDSSAKALGKILSDAGLSFSFNPMKPDFFSAEMFVLVIGAKESR